ncbi:LytTR family DNA-binding domain-containing protein [Clostridium sardiniense]|uniref:Stage 0 sporulation protein A homolog n=1 Tax=Clostridium sardiniense TaxID=29369 RepID=A0ABS7KTL8_CLOSR|nr:LytTR family DNA-binding domain-containing protein [Clostridium sardiniense]MBY0753917.1 LytTR family DNA-binding domain-containing protein [Clostridium sardiniense]MDQ0459568.1 DNA-binding LytR/AlgR family response regulator [Clostridium sardiniense]
MINIAICDDEIHDLNYLKGIIEKIALDNNIVINTECFSDAEELIKLYKRDTPEYNVIFLDIMLGKYNGIDIAKKILNIDKSVKFIILSSTKEYVFNGYEIMAVNYILKPASEDKIKKELYRALDIRNSNKGFYEINKGGKKQFLNLSDIYYFEINKRKINVYMDKQQLEYYEKIENIEISLLDKGFVRCHRGYVINISKVKEIDGNDITLINGETIPIGRKYKQNLKESFFDYLELV